jgi:hypothetical protein
MVLMVRCVTLLLRLSFKLPEKLRIKIKEHNPQPFYIVRESLYISCNIGILLLDMVTSCTVE